MADRYHVITYDLYGHGRSRPAPKRPSLEVFSNQIIELLDHCGVDHTGIVGFSLGGMVARKFAQLNPTKVSALAILHSPHKRSVDAQDVVSLRVRQTEKDGPTSTVDAALERWFTKDHRDAHPEQMELVRRWVLHTDPSIYHQNYRGFADGVDEIVAPDPAIVEPAFVITADEDFGNGPDMAHAIAAEIIGRNTGSSRLATYGANGSTEANHHAVGMVF